MTQMKHLGKYLSSMLFALFIDLIFTWVRQFLAGTPQQCDMPLCRPITVPAPPPWEIDHHSGTRSPTLYKQCVGSLTFCRILICKGREMGPMVYRPYLRRLESLTVFRSLYKGSTFSSVIWRPWVLVRLGLEPMASRLVDWHLSNWVN